MVSSFPSKNNSNDDDLDVDEPEKKQGPSLSCLYVKVSMDGAPYLRKVDLKSHHNYKDLSSALEKMFSCFTIGMHIIIHQGHIIIHQGHIIHNISHHRI